MPKNIKRYNCRFKKEFKDISDQISKSIKNDSISNKQLASMLSKVTKTLVDYKTMGCKKDKMREKEASSKKKSRKPKSKSSKKKSKKPKSKSYSKKSKKPSKSKSKSIKKQKSKLAKKNEKIRKLSRKYKMDPGEGSDYELQANSVIKHNGEFYYTIKDIPNKKFTIKNIIKRELVYEGNIQSGRCIVIPILNPILYSMGRVKYHYVYGRIEQNEKGEHEFKYHKIYEPLFVFDEYDVYDNWYHLYDNTLSWLNYNEIPILEEKPHNFGQDIIDTDTGRVIAKIGQGIFEKKLESEDELIVDSKGDILTKDILQGIIYGWDQENKKLLAKNSSTDNIDFKIPLDSDYVISDINYVGKNDFITYNLTDDDKELLENPNIDSELDEGRRIMYTTDVPVDLEECKKFMQTKPTKSAMKLSNKRAN